MPAAEDDKQMVAAFLSRIDEERLSGYEVEKRVPGITSNDVSRWRRGDWSWISGKKRRAIQRFMANGVREGPPEPQPAGQRWPDVEPDDPEDVKAYLTFFGAEAEAFRRMSKRLPLSDLAKGCLDDARAEDMPEAHFAILYDRLAHLL